MKEQKEDLFTHKETETELETGIEKALETEIVDTQAKIVDETKDKEQSNDNFDTLNKRVIVSTTPYSRNVRKLIEKGNEFRDKIKDIKQSNQQLLLPFSKDFGIKIQKDGVKVASKNKKGKMDSKSTLKVVDYNLLANKNNDSTGYLKLSIAIESEIYDKIYIKHYNKQNTPDIELKPEDFIIGGKYPLYSDSFTFYRALTETYFKQLQNFLVPYETIIKDEQGIEKPGIKFDLLYHLIVSEDRKIYIRVNKELSREDLKRLKFGSYAKATTHILTEYNDNLKTKLLIRLIEHKRINDINKKKYGNYPPIKMETLLEDIGAITIRGKQAPFERIIKPVKSIIEQINKDDKIDFKIETDTPISKMRFDKFLNIKVKIFDK